jgi:lipoate-protein ligase A
MEAGRPADGKQLPMRTAEEKVPGGKLVRVNIRPAGRVEISGDFFMYPEEGITVIEDMLGRLGPGQTAGEMEKMLEGAITSKNIRLIGIDVPTLVRLYRRCLLDDSCHL